MNIIGIDPGVTGAVALYGSDGYGVQDIPITAGFVDANALTEMIAEWDADAVWVERTHAMPTNGCKANFSAGHSLGTIVAVVRGLALPLHLVLPTEWKKTQGLVGKDKEASRGLALNLFPLDEEKLKRKKDHNRAEALLIARHGRTIHVMQRSAS